MKKVLSIIIPIMVIAAFISLAVIATNAKKIPENPSGTIGNTAGNLNNLGLFCENDGVVYFSNAYDGHYLYSMTPDGRNVQQITDVPVAYINAAGDYVYFYYADEGNAKFMGFAGNMRGLYRVKKDEKDSMTCLEKATSAIANLIDNRLYYQHYDNEEGMTLYYTSIDGKDKGKLLDEIVNPACVIGGKIYYPDEMNGFILKSYTPGSGSPSIYTTDRMYNPIPSGQYIYYMNIDDNYRLYRFDMGSNQSTKITNDRIDTFNVYGNRIFYQRNKQPALIAVNDDGTSAEVLAMGNFKNINCTSTYTYFQPFDNDNAIYMTPTFGYGQVSNFIPVP